MIVRLGEYGNGPNFLDAYGCRPCCENCEKLFRLEFFLDESLTSDPLDTEKFVMEYRARDGHTFWVAARFMHHLKMPPPSERESFQIAEMRDEIESLADEFDYSAFQLRSALLLLLLDNEVERFL